MSVPAIVQSTLNGEEIAARVSLGKEDELFVTASNTVIYSSDGILSDESVEEFPHDADRLTLSEGRRKTTFSLEYPLEGTRKFTVPASKTDAVLHPVLAGVLNGNGITETGETVVQTYRFSELTVIITSERLVKHIGTAVWDDDYEEYHFDDVTNLTFEDGSVATQVVLTVDGRPQRIKAPNDQADDLRERLQRTLFEYHEVDSLEELNETLGGSDDAGRDRDGGSVGFDDGVEPLGADPPELDDQEREETVENASASSSDESAVSEASVDSDGDHARSADGANARSVAEENRDATATSRETDTTFDMSAGDGDPGRSATDDVDVATLLDADDSDPELVERLDALEATVERQTELLERQQQTIERLIVELRENL